MCILIKLSLFSLPLLSGFFCLFCFVLFCFVFCCFLLLLVCLFEIQVSVVVFEFYVSVDFCIWSETGHSGSRHSAMARLNDDSDGVLQ